MGSINIRTKHDWAAGWLHYLAGATIEEVSELIQVPHKTVAIYASEHKWPKARMDARNVARQSIKADLERRIEAHRIKHQNFMLDTLEETQRKISDANIVLKKKTNEDLGDNEITLDHALSLTRSQDDVARKTLGLDDIKNINLVEQGFAMMMAMRGQKKDEIGESSQNDTRGPFAGILRPFNGHINAMPTLEIEAQIENTSEPGQIEEETTESYGPGQLPHHPEFKQLPKTMSFKPPAPSGVANAAPKTLVNETQGENK